ncbi:sodium:solute symporter family protein [Paraburkholderia fungorum]|uniref:sodium:solute symporter family protein n=1 Tax=Paraburkholderia fungorum TaxID=134537 RepID=UPI0020923D09|nr:sodium:solute symporter family protein [Paraburkholderia fungorum]USU14488.1 sodium:solute symporter family protein [Paraburkholderia fungorum]USU22436.1 sodium:solute symporter family protein [Paraburkholderia fungorum]
MLSRVTIVVGVTALYFAVVAFIGYSVRRQASTSTGFTTGGKPFSPILISALMLSEFIGSSVSIGTAQKGFEEGISAAWNLVALAIGFLLLGLLLVGRYRRTGLNTISAILEQTYGRGVRYAASALTIFSLNVVAVALYAAGGAVLGTVLGIGHGIATVIVGLVAIFFVTVGGFRSVVYTNTLNAVIKYLGIVLALAFALTQAGGYAHLQAMLPARMFDVSGVGVSQIVAWMIAGIGSIFATQYVIQGVVTTPDERGARRACYYVATLMIPFGIIVALIGVCSAFLYPSIRSVDAFPSIIAHMPPFAASIVVIGLAGALFGGISASTIASSTLLLRDFYEPFFKRSSADRGSLRFIRIATIVIGLIPLVLALFASKILLIAFLGKSLRATLAVLILLCFYAPRFGTTRGALTGIILSIVITVTWFLAGNPFGIDSSYFSLAAPVAAMAISHVFKSRSRETPAVTARHP